MTGCRTSFQRAVEGELNKGPGNSREHPRFTSASSSGSAEPQTWRLPANEHTPSPEPVWRNVARPVPRPPEPVSFFPKMTPPSVENFAKCKQSGALLRPLGEAP